MIAFFSILGLIILGLFFLGMIEDLIWFVLQTIRHGDDDFFGIDKRDS